MPSHSQPASIHTPGQGFIGLRAQASCLGFKTRYALRKGLDLPSLWRQVLRCGPGVVETHGVSLAVQFLDILHRVWRHQIHPEHYYWYRLYLKPHSETPLYFHPNALIARHEYLLEALGIDLYALKDKRRYHEVCRRHQLPAPQMIAVFQDAQIEWNGPEEIPDTDLFSKEAATGRGIGARNWTRISQRCWQSPEGEALTRDQLLDRLAELSKSVPQLLQVKLRPHPAIADLSPTGASTARVMTCIEPDGSDCRVFAATFKMLKAGAPTDHWRNGGIAPPVDLDTGELGTARKRPAEFCHEDHHYHPDTGGHVTGRRLPLWKELVETVTRAHRCFPEFHSLGWDVGITDGGIVLLEANVTWEARIVQQPGSTPLGATPFFSCLLNWHRRAVTLGRRLSDSPYFHGWRACERALAQKQTGLA